MPLERVYIGMGSNLGDGVGHLRFALTRMLALEGVVPCGTSRLYKSAPVGPQDQPDYFNAVQALDTSLSPLALLDHLQAIEQACGRVRTRRWGARTLDLDMLLYGERIIRHPRLSVPHPEMKKRHFVLHPLADLAPGLVFPCGERLEDLASALGDIGLVVLDHAHWPPGGSNEFVT